MTEVVRGRHFVVYEGSPCRSPCSLQYLRVYFDKGVPGRRKLLQVQLYPATARIRPNAFPASSLSSNILFLPPASHSCPRSRFSIMATPTDQAAATAAASNTAQPAGESNIIAAQDDVEVRRATQYQHERLGVGSADVLADISA